MTVGSCLLVGCDQGKQTNEGLDVGPAVNVIATNLASNTLPADGRIEISFDRLLLPACITRQTFIFLQSGGPPPPPPTVTYDPVARVVVITPGEALTAGQPYTLTIASPASSSDPNGLRAIDGAQLSPAATATYSFVAGAASGAPLAPTSYVDYCSKVATVFQVCAGCHLAPTFSDAGLVGANYAGLSLDQPVGVEMTAIGQVAHGSNTGTQAGGGQPPGLLFAQDMPIIDPGPGPSGPDVATGTPSTSGDPGHSWLMYKVLMAIPGTSTGASPANYTVKCSAAGDPCPQPLPDDERARLAALVLGREMPYPSVVDSGAPGPGLSLDDLETLDQWIAGGAPLPASLACGP